MDDLFEQYRPLLFSIAYRMLGSGTEAEDVVQDAFLRYTGTSREEIRSPKAFFSAIVSRLCLDRLKSARARREQYVGTWLPEPLLTTGNAVLPPQDVEQKETLALAFLTLLERLSPQERAVFILRELFDYPYPEIADILDRSVPACRQLLSRARLRLSEARVRFEHAPDMQHRLTERFIMACQEGSLPELTALLAEDVTSWADGGGHVTTALRPIRGRAKVARLFLSLVQKAPEGLIIRWEEINGSPGLVLWQAGRILYVVVLSVSAEQVTDIQLVANPEKLLFLLRQLEGYGRVPTR